MKKQFIAYLITGTLLLTGCGNAITNQNSDNANNSATSNITNQDVSITNLEDVTYETIGKVIQIEEGKVHVLTGDIAEIFPVPQSDLDYIYIGETVSIQKETEDMYSIMSYKLDDFSSRFTSMGDPIERVSAVLTKVSETTITFEINETSTSFDYNAAQTLVVGQTYIIDYLDFGNEEHYIIDIFDVNNTLELTIQEINRNTQGEMILLSVDKQGGQYIIPTYSAAKNFNLSDLSLGQSIKVYPIAIMESSPAQVEANRIDLLSEVPLGTTSIDYDVIGEVVLIEEGNVHILSGDMIQIFTLNKEYLENIHLGETVKLYQEEDSLIIEPYIKDFSSRFTTMGQRIETVTGVVVSIKDEDPKEVTVSLSDQVITYVYYGNEHLDINTQYEFDVVEFTPDEKSILTVYNPDTIIEMTITELSRAENGELMLSTLDEDGGQYSLSTSSSHKNFNLSELMVGDVLLVYADTIMESWPMQVHTRKMIKK